MEFKPRVTRLMGEMIPLDDSDQSQEDDFNEKPVKLTIMKQARCT